MIDFHDPRAETGVAVEPYELEFDVLGNIQGDRGATLGYLANGFPDSDTFLSFIAEAVEALVPGVKSLHWNNGNASIPASDQMLGEIRSSCRAVVAAYGH